MGIEKFQSWLKNTYYMAIDDYNYYPYDHIYVDLNFMLHRLVSYVSSEQELIAKTIQAITTIVSNNKPLKSLTLAADGSATYAKILLQKKRRLQTAQSSQDNISLKLTPGTQFMDDFNQSLRKHVKSQLTKVIGRDIVYNIDLSDKSDESEFKICRYIRKNALSLYDTHLVLSNDADIVLISMAQVDIYNINIVIQMAHDNTYIISVDKIIEHHLELYGYNLLKRLDFVFVSLLNGNDYFPKLKFSNIEKMWLAYKDVVRPNETIMRRDGSFNMSTLVKFLSAVMRRTPKHLDNSQLKDVCNHDIKDYLIGIKWCMSLYSTGLYLSYDYMYNGQCINPTDLALYILINGISEVSVPQSVSCTIPDKIYSIIVLPYSAKHLIRPEYHKLLDTKLQYIYEEEMCSKCKTYREHYNCSDEDCKYTMKKYIVHAKTHAITKPQKYISDIVDIIKNYTLSIKNN